MYAKPLKASGEDRRTLPRTETRRFSLVGISWGNAKVEFDGTDRVRTRSPETGGWSD